VVDNGDDKVRRYASSATRTSGSQDPTNTYPLHAENTRPSDIVTRNNLFWVTDELRDQVFVYDIHQANLRYLGRWDLDPANADAGAAERIR
jgi:hypothetical protein